MVATAELIEDALVRNYRRTQSFIVPNVHALGHESDALVLTKSNYLLEIEIKVSLADFRADLRGKAGSPKWARQAVMEAAASGKRILGWHRNGYWLRDGVNPDPITDPAVMEGDGEHRRLQAPTCPNRFAYAYPAELHDQIAEEAPAWAGLMPISEAHNMFWVEDRRRGRLLHRDTASDAVRHALFSSTYHRFWTERNRRRQIEQDLDYLRRQGSHV